MRYGLTFLLLGLVCAAYVFIASHPVIRIAFASGSLCFIIMGLGFLRLGPRIFLKQPHGRLHPLSYALYWPYHIVNAVSMLGVAKLKHENALDMILPNLYLGRHLTLLERGIARDSKIEAVLDVTSEFARCAPLRGASHYKCIPLLDTYAASVDQLQEGANFIEAHISQRPVFVHCAMGHGRSATMAAAYLLHSEQAASVDEALQFLRGRRPEVGFSISQRAALEAFAAKQTVAEKKD